MAQEQCCTAVLERSSCEQGISQALGGEACEILSGNSCETRSAKVRLPSCVTLTSCVVLCNINVLYNIMLLTLKLPSVCANLGRVAMFTSGLYSKH